MKKQRKHYTPEEKVAILRRHLLDKEPISKLCDELGLQPTVFYRWHKEFFENGAAAFEQKRPSQPLRRAGADRLSGEEDAEQGRGPRRTDGGARRAKKRDWGTLTCVWVPHDTRDQVVDFVRRWSEKTEIGAGRFIAWLDITTSKFYDWRERYGKVNEHNGWVPRDFWLEDWEKQAIIGFHLKNPEARPRIISDNGPQFIAKDFKEFIRISGMTHVRTSPYYPQSNGKIERWHNRSRGSASGLVVRLRTRASAPPATQLG